MFYVFIKVFRLAYKHSRSKTLYLNFLLIISTILEGLSFAVILPVIELFINNDKNSIIYKFLPFLKTDNENLIMNVIFIISSVFIAKSLFLCYFSWWRSGYTKELNEYFKLEIFKIYIYKDYNFFLTNRPSSILRNAYNEVGIFLSAIDQILRLISEILLFLIIFLVLAIFESKITIIAVSFFGISGLVYLLIFKNKLHNWSEKCQYYTGKIIQTIQQSIETIKFLKISNIENKILSDYKKNVDSYAKYQRYRNFLGDMPRIYLELLGIGLILSVLYGLYDQNRDDLSYLVPSLGLIAVAGVRLLPSVGKIINHLQSIYGAAASIKTIQEDLLSDSDKHINETSNKLQFFKEIELKNINYMYPKSKEKILDNFNLTIKKNEFICIMGGSGVGKTTIVDLIAGIIDPKNGSILIDKKILDENNKKNWQLNIGYVFQNSILYSGSIRENISITDKKKINDDEQVNKAIISAEIDSLVKGKPEGLDFLINERGTNLSGGQIQRMAIARSLYSDPDILILDEFTSALDLQTQEKVFNTIELLKGKKTIIVISHNKLIMQKADRVINLEKNINGVIKAN